MVGLIQTLNQIDTEYISTSTLPDAPYNDDSSFDEDMSDHEEYRQF